MTRSLFAIILATSLVSIPALSYTITYDHAARAFKCGTPATTCTGTIPTGKSITVLVTRSVPDLLAVNIEVAERLPDKDTAAAIRTFLSPPAPAAAGTGGTGTSTHSLLANMINLNLQQKSTADAWRDLRQAVQDVRNAVPNNLNDYPGAIVRVRDNVAQLAANLGNPDDGSTFLTALKAASTQPPTFSIGMSDDQVKEFWPEVVKLANARTSLSDFGASSFRPNNDFTLTLTFSGKNKLIPVSETETSDFIASTSVTVLTSTGIGYSGLVDDHYTSVTITDTPAKDSTPAVTHREGRKEKRDAGFPEAVLLIHIGAVSDTGYFSMPWVPRTLSVGGGISSGISGRLYAGISWNLGNVGRLTIGRAGGKVKRLSEGVDLKNLGQIDPEATRRDVFEKSYFVGLTFKLPSP